MYSLKFFSIFGKYKLFEYFYLIYSWLYLEARLKPKHPEEFTMEGLKSVYVFSLVRNLYGEVRNAYQRFPDKSFINTKKTFVFFKFDLLYCIKWLFLTLCKVRVLILRRRFDGVSIYLYILSNVYTVKL